MPERRATNEMVPFRLIVCPECDHQVCWVNPRLPSYCPECGRHIFAKLRAGRGVLNEATAWLRIEHA
jgi:ribosomal protein S27E